MNAPSSARSETFDGLMLAEHAHRIANDMALAIAELEICRSQLPDDTASRVLATTADHLRHICSLQRRLLPPAQGHVDLDALLGDVAESVVRARGGGRDIRLDLRLTPLRVPSRFAWQLATVVAELLTNALKHGAARFRGEIWLSLEKRGHHLSCAVADDGPCEGPPGPKGSGQGCRIVEAIAEDLGGIVERGTTATRTVVRLLLPSPVESSWPRGSAVLNGVGRQ